jgi:hypothetical protein
MEMMTSVKFRRLGAARRLVEWGLQQADKLGVPAYLSSSPDGYHVYSKLNFRELDHLTFSVEEYGGEGTYVQSKPIFDMLIQSQFMNRFANRPLCTAAMIRDPVIQVGTPAK